MAIIRGLGQIVPADIIVRDTINTGGTVTNVLRTVTTGKTFYLTAVHFLPTDAAGRGRLIIKNAAGTEQWRIDLSYQTAVTVTNGSNWAYATGRQLGSFLVWSNPVAIPTGWTISHEVNNSEGFITIFGYEN